MQNPFASQPLRPWGAFTDYQGAVIPGIGHHGVFRIAHCQAVRPNCSHSFDVFERGRPIETNLSWDEARRLMIQRAKESHHA